MNAEESADVVDAIAAKWRRELPQVDGLPLELSKRVIRLAALINAATESELERHGLTKAEYEVLAILRATGSPYRLKPNELAQALLLSSGGTTNIVHRLVAAELVTREADPDDRRSSAVRLTAEGVEKADTAVLAVNAVHGALLEPLGQAGGRAFADELRRVLGVLDDRLLNRR